MILSLDFAGPSCCLGLNCSPTFVVRWACPFHQRFSFRCPLLVQLGRLVAWLPRRMAAENPFGSPRSSDGMSAKHRNRLGDAAGWEMAVSAHNVGRLMPPARSSFDSWRYLAGPRSSVWCTDCETQLQFATHWLLACCPRLVSSPIRRALVFGSGPKSLIA